MKIFIVEDSELMKTRITNAVNRVVGAQVSGHARDIKSAYSSICELCPDVLVIDFQLRNGSGLTLIKKLKNERPELRVIVLSNSSSSQYRHAAFLAGADCFLDKSTEFGQFAGVLANWLPQPFTTCPQSASASPSSPSVQR